MGDHLCVDILPRYVTKPTWSTQPCIPLGSLNRIPAWIGWDKGRNVTSARWQVTLCNPIWHVSSHSGEACCELLYLVTLLLLTYYTLLTYKVTVSVYLVFKGDSLRYHRGQKFSTRDQDNDVVSAACAVRYKGAWWYGSCHNSNLNGLYLRGNHSSYANGVNWKHWTGYYYSLRFTEMKIRPYNFWIEVQQCPFWGNILADPYCFQVPY